MLQIKKPMAKCKGLSIGVVFWKYEAPKNAQNAAKHGVGWWDLDTSKLYDFHQSGCDQKLVFFIPKCFRLFTPPFREFLCTYDTYVCAFQDWDSKESLELFVKKTPAYLVGKKQLVAWKKSYQSHQAGFAGDDDVSKQQRFFQGGLEGWWRWMTITLW